MAKWGEATAAVASLGSKAASEVEGEWTIITLEIDGVTTTVTILVSPATTTIQAATQRSHAVISLSYFSSLASAKSTASAASAAAATQTAATTTPTTGSNGLQIASGTFSDGGGWTIQAFSAAATPVSLAGRSAPAPVPVPAPARVERAWRRQRLQRLRPTFRAQPAACPPSCLTPPPSQQR